MLRKVKGAEGVDFHFGQNNKRTYGRKKTGKVSSVQRSKDLKPFLIPNRHKYHEIFHKAKDKNMIVCIWITSPILQLDVCYNASLAKRREEISSPGR